MAGVIFVALTAKESRGGGIGKHWYAARAARPRPLGFAQTGSLHFDPNTKAPAMLYADCPRPLFRLAGVVACLENAFALLHCLSDGPTLFRFLVCAG